MARFRTFVAFASVLFLIAACGPLAGVDPIPTVVTSQLAGENQVPPVATPAGGEVTATLTGTTLVVAGFFDGLTSDLTEVAGSSAHIHHAAAGENGPIVENLTVVSPGARSGTVAGTLTLTAEQVERFEAGEYYVNIHTSDHPQGELRAQLAADAPTFAQVMRVFDATLTPDNEPHDVTSDAGGSTTGVLRDDGTLTVSGTFEDLGSPLFDVGDVGPAHVHEGAFGVAGPVAFPLDVVPDDGDLAGRFGGTTAFTPEQIDALLAGGYYVNIHSETYEAGEIRGQLFPSTVEATATLEGDQQVSPVETEATGTATATMDGFGFTVDGSFEGLQSPLHEVGDLGPAHIHAAPRGQNGPVVFPLAVDSPDDVSGTFSLDTELTEEQRAEFLAGDYYVNVHTNLNQAGEIRGQFEPFAITNASETTSD